MTDEEKQLQHILSAKAAEPDPQFREKLRQELLAREYELTGKKPKRSITMQTKILAGMFSGMALLGLLTVGLVLSQRGTNTSEEVATTENTSNEQTDDTRRMAQSSTMSSELAAGDVQDPLAGLSFTPLQPTILLASEVPDPMLAGSGDGMVDDSDTLYMSFSDDSGVLYKITQTTKSGTYPEDAESVAITVKDKAITAGFYRVSEESDPSGTSPRTYLFWSDGGVTYQISEFGRVSRDDLVRLANSLI